MQNSEKKTLLSGITATGKLTLANYIGAIKNMVKLQEEYNNYIFIADLHALTLPIDPKQLSKIKRTFLHFILHVELTLKRVCYFFNQMSFNTD